MPTHTRRRFTTLAAAAGLSPALRGLSTMAQPSAPEAEPLLLQPNGWMPNNPRLPVLLYRAAVPTAGDTATRMETLFTANGWPPQWRNGVYTYHHYHSTAHEVLGFARGQARLVLGGPTNDPQTGQQTGPATDIQTGPSPSHELTVHAGDVLLLPTGTGHCEISCSADLLVIGAYPPNQHWDICRQAPDAAAQKRMASLPFPSSDPVHGADGPLRRLWPNPA